MRFSRPVAALAVALLVVTAGCSGMLTGDSETTTTGTEAPAESTEPTGSAETTTTIASADLSESSLPAGVTEAGLENVSALLAAHNQSLDGAAYRVSIDIDGDRQKASVAMTHGEDARRLRVETRNSTIRGWQRGTGTAIARTTDGTTQYQYADGKESSLRAGFDTYASVTTVFVGSYLTAGDYDVTGVVTRNGTELVKLTADKPNQTAVEKFSDNGTLDSFEATALVDQNGVVHSLEATLTETVNGKTTTGTVNYEISDLGAATAERPDWLAEVPRLDSSVTDGGVVAVEHAGGATLASGTKLTMMADDTLDSVTLAEDVTDGETVYLYVAEDADGQQVVRASVGEKPPAGEVATDLSTVTRLRITGSAGSVSVVLSPSA